MGVFATEFPVTVDFSSAAFVAASIAWIRGMESSQLKIDRETVESYHDELFFHAANDEKFTIKRLNFDEGFVIGARHDIFDNAGLNWRTELVLTNSGTVASLRAKGQCFSGSSKNLPLTPKKPFFIKSIIQDGLCEKDGPWKVSDFPIFLREEEIAIAASAILGELSTHLPIVYVSLREAGGYCLDVKKLAYNLGGVAHVIVEPSIRFSRRLAEATARMNPYGGTVGFCSPIAGLTCKFYIGGPIITDRQLQDAVQSYVIRFQATCDALLGWEWQSLQTEFARDLRKRRTDVLTEDEKAWEAELLAEISAKDEMVINLRQRLDILQNTPNEYGYSDGLLSPSLVSLIGVELYENEFSDRLLIFIESALSSTTLELGKRTRIIAQKVLDLASNSKRNIIFKNDLKNAGRDYKSATGQLREILAKLGFYFSEEGSHLKCTPPEELLGVEQITLAKTPSDSRAGMNMVRDIRKALDLRDLT